MSRALHQHNDRCLTDWKAGAKEDRSYSSHFTLDSQKYPDPSPPEANACILFVEVATEHGVGAVSPKAVSTNL